MLDSTANTKIQHAIGALDKALATGDIDGALKLFNDDCYWRDFVSFTWNLKTLAGKDEIRAMLKARLADVKPSGWKMPEDEVASSADGLTEGFIQFETAVARGEGYIKLKDGKIWVLLTTMKELKGHEEPAGPTRPLGALHGMHLGDASWLEDREKEKAELGIKTQPYVLIVGGAQAGIILGARLRQLGVPTLIIEKHGRPGDNWRSRYKSLCTHDPVWYDHLPYIKFPQNWPIFMPKDKIAGWLDMFADVMELDYWGHTEARKATYDEKTRTWTVKVVRDGKEITLKPKQLVLATGMSGKPNKPKFPGQDKFKGIQKHSSEYGGDVDALKGKRVVVIGSNNSAHDICGALAENGIDVTMVQRSSTHVSRSQSLMKHALGPLYSEEAVAAGLTTEKADLLFAAIPYALMCESLKPSTEAIKKDDAKFYEGLKKRGFMMNFGPGDGGLFALYLFRASGYYIDIGASQLIIDGKIKLASGSQVKELTEHGVLLEDGRELPADVVVYATGYASMNSFAADLISKEVANKVGKCWGVGSNTPLDPGPWEGEQRNMWKPTQQEGLWFEGGNLAQSRFYSQYMALQLKARQEGIPTPVYGLQDVHHREFARG
ncbi:MAG: NAD(P)/FAD-dependent oxidoreductase [Burkholderiaceae bacterium]|nr:MAG: NAD(P)/FAD-dependent oxidoreductase [Burkholderiaceae bacterium]